LVCHGANPQALAAAEAHEGIWAKAMPTGPTTFYPDTGSVWIADHSCGQAGYHPGYPYRMERAPPTGRRPSSQVRDIDHGGVIGVDFLLGEHPPVIRIAAALLEPAGQPADQQ
jgi:hypothetical protein